MITGIFPGSFDPPTMGHMDLIKRAVGVTDHLIIAVLRNSRKNPLFSVEERIELLDRCIGKENFKNRITIDAFDGMLADYAREKNCRIIIRGLRNTADFEYEQQIAAVNRRLNPDLETFYLGSLPEYEYLSASIVKEIAMYKKDLTGCVPKEIQHIVEKKFSPSDEENPSHK